MTSDEEIVEEQLRKAKLKEERAKEELRTILEDDKVRYWIWQILTQCGVFHTLSAADTHQMAIRSGRRDIGLWILEQVFEADKAAFHKMQIEAEDRENEHE